MKIGPSLPKDKAKFILGSLLLAILLLVIFQIRQHRQSVITLKSFDNKFKLEFAIAQNDQQVFSKLLEKLSLPQSVQQGVEFELDATSSAKLSFSLPIDAKLEITPQKVKAEGTTHALFLEEAVMEDLKLPSSTNLALFSPSVMGFLNTKFSLPSQFQEWLNKNLPKDGQYLVIFGQNADFAIIFRSEDIDFEGLKNIKIEGEEPPYKTEESQDTINFHLLKLHNQKGAPAALTLTFFKIGKWVYMVSSREAARQLTSAQKSNQAHPVNFSAPKGQPVSLVILFRNQDTNPIGQEFGNFLFPEARAVTRTLDKIDQLQFILKANQFSALINIK